MHNHNKIKSTFRTRGNQQKRSLKKRGDCFIELKETKLSFQFGEALAAEKIQQKSWLMDETVKTQAIGVANRLPFMPHVA